LPAGNVSAAIVSLENSMTLSPDWEAGKHAAQSGWEADGKQLYGYL
jgi:hypothetical protein